jgi:hypothetical protein
VDDGQKRKNAGIARVLANSNPVWKNAWKILVYNLPPGWTGIGEDIRFMVEELNLPPPKLKEQAWGGLVSKVGIPLGFLEFVQPIIVRQMIDPKGHAKTSQVLQRTRLRYDDANGRSNPVTPQFDLGTRIRQVREAEARMKAEEAALEAKQKKLKDWTVIARAEILEFLNATNQKSANTEWGTTYWKPKVTYRVEDKTEFQRHVIGHEAWELLTWATAGNAAEAFTTEHGVPPPGTVRNSVRILYINAPAKPRTKVAQASTGSEAEETAEEEMANE